MNVKHRRLASVSLIFLSGCGLFGKKKDQVIARPVSHEPGALSPEPRPSLLAIANGNPAKPVPLADPLPPPPPDLLIAAIPAPMPKDTAIVSQPKPADALNPASGVLPPASEPAMLVQAVVK